MYAGEEVPMDTEDENTNEEKNNYFDLTNENSSKEIFRKKKKRKIAMNEERLKVGLFILNCSNEGTFINLVHHRSVRSRVNCMMFTIHSLSYFRFQTHTLSMINY